MSTPTWVPLMRFLSLLLCLSLFSGSCNRSNTSLHTPDQGEILVGKGNQKYDLELVFHTMEVTKGNRIVDAVSIRDRNKAEVVKFEPLDPQSLLLADGYTRNVSWSPDEEYLILPLGQFDGFCIVKSNQALGSVREKKCLDTIRIQLNTGLQMSHEFVSWDGNSAFVFKAGMENSFPQFKYDISKRRVTAVERTNDIFEAYNLAGKLAISQN